MRSIAKLGPLLVGSFAILSVGCSIMLPPDQGLHRKVSGQDIDREAVSEIVPGKTTRREIIERFGEPERTGKSSDGGEELVYMYTGVIERRNELILWASKSLKDERKRLRVAFAGDVVRSVGYTNSALPKDNLSMQAGSAEVELKTVEGLVGFTNEFNQVKLDVAQGLAAKVVQNASGTLDIGIPATNKNPLRMRVRERFGSVNPGTDFKTSVTEKETDVAVSKGSLVVRSRTGCDLVDAGNHKEVSPPESGAAAATSEIRFPSVHFGFKLTTPIATEVPLLDCAGDLLKDYSDVRVRIEGHSDNIGSNEHNLRLSKARAEAARRVLIASGIPASRLEAVGYGKTKPIASNKTEEGRAQNRRIDFKVLGAS